MRAELLAAVVAARAARRAVVRVTRLADGADRLVGRDDDLAGDPLAEALDAAFRTGRSGLVADAAGGRHVLTVYVPPPRLVAVGAVHITQALAPMAVAAGFDLTVIDPRTAFATPERFAGVRLLAEWPADVIPARVAVDAHTAVIAVTHDPKIDDMPLAAALASDAFYVGALGSRKTHAKRIERLTAAGIAPEMLARIRAPIGLDIGAVSPAEIAVSILAEIIAALRGPRRRPA